MVISKTALAARLHVSCARVSQFVAMGMPTLPDGRVDLLDAADWVACTIDPGVAAPSRAVRAAKSILAQRPTLSPEDVRALRKALMAAT
jgi:hypothetical protein